LRLPAGRHTVRIWYWPPLFTFGLGLCLVGALACLALLSNHLHGIFTDLSESGLFDPIRGLLFRQSVTRRVVYVL
ncbi:MAG: hypothetical protein ACP5QO_12150, partial [Clostridia bacterium]